MNGKNGSVMPSKQFSEMYLFNFKKVMGKNDQIIIGFICQFKKKFHIKYHFLKVVFVSQNDRILEVNDCYWERQKKNEGMNISLLLPN
jgi:hypothetical protein